SWWSVCQRSDRAKRCPGANGPGRIRRGVVPATLQRGTTPLGLAAAPVPPCSAGTPIYPSQRWTGAKGWGELTSSLQRGREVARSLGAERDLLRVGDHDHG